MSNTLQTENISESKPAGRPISYRVTTTATWGQVWPFCVLAVLYLIILTTVWSQHRQPIVFDPLSFCFAAAIPLRIVQYLFNRRQRQRYQQAVVNTGTLLESPVFSGGLWKAQILSGIFLLGLLGLLAFTLRIIATSPRPIPAFFWFYPPPLLMEVGLILVTARGSRVRLLTTGIVYEDRLFQTFFPWAGIKEIIWFSDTQKLRIEYHDIPDWQTLRLSFLSDTEREQLFVLIEQHAPLKRA